MNAAKYRPRQRHWAYSIKLQSASVEHSEARIYTQKRYWQELGIFREQCKQKCPAPTLGTALKIYATSMNFQADYSVSQ